MPACRRLSLQQELGDTEPHKPVPGDPGTGKQGKDKDKKKSAGTKPSAAK